MEWNSCYELNKIPWLSLRDSFLFIILNPQITIFLIWLFIFIFSIKIKLRFVQKTILTLIITLTISLIYTPFGTSQIEHFLNKQTILFNKESYKDIDLIFIPGRGEEIAKFTTEKASSLYQQMNNPFIYISGDDKSTAINLVNLGIDKDKISGDSCAQTTLENIKLTQKWIDKKSLKGEIFVITDKWHLPRLSRTFFANNLKVSGVGINPKFSKREENKIAIRELLGYILYKYQRRLDMN